MNSFAVRAGKVFIRVIGVCAMFELKASAESSSASGTEYAICPIDAGAFLHNGFFARSEAGLSLLEASVSDSGKLRRRSRIRAIGQSASVSIGATPASGLVVGVSIWTAILDPTFVEDGRTVIPDDNSVKLTLLRVGPMLDWYPNPRRGYHFFGAAGFAVQIEHDAKGNPIYPIPMGVSASTGTGYEWFLSDELSVGLLGRFAFGWLTRTPSNTPERMLFVSPELALTATYH